MEEREGENGSLLRLSMLQISIHLKSRSPLPLRERARERGIRNLSGANAATQH
jgi:hypothetical protein